MFDFLKRDKYCGIDWVNVKPIELDDYYVHQVDEKGNTPLYYAALYCEDIWVFERLIDLGADIHEKPVPDLIARDIELVKLFLKHKAKFSLSILECYCPYKSFELLIDSGVAANATPEELDTIFYSYVYENQNIFTGTSRLNDEDFYMYAEKLRSMGAKLNNPSPLMFFEVNSRFTEGAHISRFHDRDKMIFQLLEWGASTDVRNHEGLSPFNIAAFYCDAHVVEKYLEHGAHPDDNCALISAVSTGNVEVVELLLKAGADPNILTGPLRNEKKPRTNILISSGVMFSLNLEISLSALHVACSRISYDYLHDKHAQPKIVRMLIKYGADVNAITDKDRFLQDMAQYTPLDYALKSLEEFSWRIVIKKRASHEMRYDMEHNNSHDNFTEIVKILKDAGAKYHETTNVSKRILTDYKD